MADNLVPNGSCGIAPPDRVTLFELLSLGNYGHLSNYRLEDMIILHRTPARLFQAIRIIVPESPCWVVYVDCLQLMKCRYHRRSSPACRWVR